MTERTLNNLFEEERTRLEMLDSTCLAQGEYLHPVFSSGPIDADVAFIGEAPGAEETACGTPFVGKAGRQLNDLLSMAGIDRKHVYMTNAVKFRPVVRGKATVRNRTPGKREICDSIPLLRKELFLIRPKVIITLGGVPLLAASDVFGIEKHTIGEVHGQRIDISSEMGQAVLFPLYHPASAIYNRELLPVLRDDAMKLGSFLYMHFPRVMINPSSDK